MAVGGDCFAYLAAQRKSLGFDVNKMFSQGMRVLACWAITMLEPWIHCHMHYNYNTIRNTLGSKGPRFSLRQHNVFHE